MWIQSKSRKLLWATLDPAGDEPRAVQVVPSGCWQGARPVGAYTLSSYTVWPGFDYKGFQLLLDCPGEMNEILEGFPPDPSSFL